jgi:tripeptidyl-peptidase-1
MLLGRPLARRLPAMVSLVLLLASLAGICSAAPAPALINVAPHTLHQLKESVHTPRDWVRLGAAPADAVIPLRIALPQVNFVELERQLYEVSDPDHERYGQHLSKEEVEALVAPHPASLSAVDEWLAGHGLSGDDLERTPARDWVTVRVPVALAEEMLDTVRHSHPHWPRTYPLCRTRILTRPHMGRSSTHGSTQRAMT